jgi:hypothetical protein
VAKKIDRKLNFFFHLEIQFGIGRRKMSLKKKMFYISRMKNKHMKKGVHVKEAFTMSSHVNFFTQKQKQKAIIKYRIHINVRLNGKRVKNLKGNFQQFHVIDLERTFANFFMLFYFYVYTHFLTLGFSLMKHMRA